MKNHLLLFTVLFASLANAEEAKFSEWMSSADLDSYIQIIKESKYKENGFMVQAVEGRYVQNRDEYRVKIVSPINNVSSWWWWLGQDLNSFTQKMKEYEAKGAALHQGQSYTRPDGSTAYQGIWFVYR